MHTGALFNHETVRLDGVAFTDCEFRNCRLVYAGGDAPSFVGCKFGDCEWRLEDAALRTLAHLKAMWNAGAKTPVQALIKDITGGGK
jgi:hypothetical protein